MIPKQIPNLWHCPQCKAALEGGTITLSLMVYEAAPVLCPSCGVSSTVWHVACSNLQDGVWASEVFWLLGCKTTVGTVTLTPDKPIALRTVEWGVPLDAMILDINYTPQEGGLFPIESSSMSNTPHRRGSEIPHEITLLPHKFSGTTEPSDTVVCIMICWVERAEGDQAWENLVTACREHFARRYDSMVIPANVAVESRLQQLLTGFVSKHIGNNRTEALLQEATYSHQLNALLPLITGMLGLPSLSSEIRGWLNRLRSLRNQLAHQGKLECSIPRDQSAKLLTSALLGFYYLDLLKRALPP